MKNLEGSKMVKLHDIYARIVKMCEEKTDPKQEGKAESVDKKQESVDMIARKAQWDSTLDSDANDYIANPAMANFAKGRRALHKAKESLWDMAVKGSYLNDKEFQVYFGGVIEKLGTYCTGLKEDEADAAAKRELEIIINDYSKSHSTEEIEQFKGYADKLLDAGARKLSGKYRNLGLGSSMGILIESALRGKEKSLPICIDKIVEASKKEFTIRQAPEAYDEFLSQTIDNVLGLIVSGREEHLNEELAGTEKLERYGRAAFYSVLKDLYPQVEDRVLRSIIDTEQVEPHKVRFNALKLRCYIIDFAVPFINNKEPKEGFLELMQIMVDQKEKGNKYVEQIVAYGTVKNDEGTKDWAGWYIAR
jgi:hypothetical protein